MVSDRQRDGDTQRENPPSAIACSNIEKIYVIDHFCSPLRFLFSSSLSIPPVSFPMGVLCMHRWRGSHHKDKGVAEGHGGVCPREQDQPHFRYLVRGLQGTWFRASQQGLRKKRSSRSVRECVFRGFACFLLAHVVLDRGRTLSTHTKQKQNRACSGPGTTSPTLPIPNKALCIPFTSYR